MEAKDAKRAYQELKRNADSVIMENEAKIKDGEKRKTDALLLGFEQRMK